MELAISHTALSSPADQIQSDQFCPVCEFWHGKRLTASTLPHSGLVARKLSAIPQGRLSPAILLGRLFLPPNHTAEAKNALDLVLGFSQEGLHLAFGKAEGVSELTASQALFRIAGIFGRAELRAEHSGGAQVANARADTKFSYGPDLSSASAGSRWRVAEK